jgi:beta-lactamase regulating signal transducer with metallopeptidase domain
MTLLHSLWQILLIYLILKIILVKLKKSDSRIRYNISGLSLIASLIIAGITFSIYFQNEKTIVQDSRQLLMSLNPEIITAYFKQIPETNSSGNFNLYGFLPYLVILYLTGVLLLTIKLTGSLLYLRKYKRSGIVTVDQKLEKLFSGIVRKLSLKKNINIIESLKAKSPLVIGYLKPVVIVPAGFFTQLPYNQVEAILAHELAHIKRNDFLVNIIQSIIELLFFYHPAVYLISKHIREERENCCDDIAIEFCNDSSQYVKALANMQNVINPSSYPAVAFAAKKKLLVNRINRILKSRNMKTKNSDRLVAGSIILAGIFTILLTSAATFNNLSGKNSIPLESEHQPGVSINDAYSAENQADTIIDYDADHILTHRKNADGEDEKIEMTFTGGKLSLLKVNGKVIPESRYKEYRNVIKETQIEVKKASSEVAKAEQELDALDEEEIERKIEEALEEAREINEEEIEQEIKKAQKEIEEIDQDEIRREVERALAEAKRELEDSKVDKIDMDSLKMAISIAMNSVNWDEIEESIRIAMEEAEMSEEEMEKAMEEVNRALDEIDWDKIQASIDEGLAAARSSLESIQWDVIMESINVSLDITSDVLENIAKEIEVSMKDMEGIDVKADINEAREQVRAEKEKLGELENNMEKALEELEKK